MARALAAALLVAAAPAAIGVGACTGAIAGAPPRLPAPAPAPAQSPFPERWAGLWAGTLEIFAGPAVRQRVPIRIEISATPGPEGYRWRTIYADDTTRGVKDYALRVVDAAMGRYATDERNGILLDARLLGDALVSAYAVAGRTFHTRTEVRGDTMTFDLVFWPDSSVRGSRGGGANGEGGNPVRAFDVAGRQRAILTRRR